VELKNSVVKKNFRNSKKVFIDKITESRAKNCKLQEKRNTFDVFLCLKLKNIVILFCNIPFYTVTQMVDLPYTKTCSIHLNNIVSYIQQNTIYSCLNKDRR